MEDDDAENYTILEEQTILQQFSISSSGKHFVTFTTA
jgi:hypothetical protein